MAADLLEKVAPANEETIAATKEDNETDQTNAGQNSAENNHPPTRTETANPPGDCQRGADGMPLRNADGSWKRKPGRKPGGVVASGPRQTVGAQNPAPGGTGESALPSSDGLMLGSLTADGISTLLNMGFQTQDFDFKTGEREGMTFAWAKFYDYYEIAEPPAWCIPIIVTGQFILSRARSNADIAAKLKSLIPGKKKAPVRMDSHPELKTNGQG